MPTLTTTIEDTSPVIVYSGTGGGDWTTGTSRLDPLTDQYSQSSYMVTNVESADVSFSFYGTGVQIYGAKRSGHGPYQISIDSFVYPLQTGGVSGDATFQTALFSTVALNNGYHAVRMTNLGTASLDIDFITWQTPVGLANEALLAWTDEDTNPAFTYTPEAAWNANPSNVGMFSGGSGHSTSAAGACVEYSFIGDSVAIFGPVGPNGAPYSARLDDRAPANYSAYKRFYRPQMILYQAGNLGSGKHTVRLVSQAWNNSATAFAVDYAQVFTTQSLQPSNSGLSAGTIVGISFGVITLLLALLVSFILCRRRKPSAFKKLFRPTTKMADPTSTITSGAFEYIPISHDESSPNPLLTSSSRQRLLVTPSVSHPTSSPSTAMWPTSGGSYNPSATELMLSVEQNGPDTQLITIPYTADGKYRPDLSVAPQLMPPPQGAIVRRTSSSSNIGQTMQLRETYRQVQSTSRAPIGGAARQQSPAFLEHESNAQQTVAMMPAATSRMDGNGQRAAHAQPAAVLAPVRRTPSVPVSVTVSELSDLTSPPPQYQRHPT